MFEIKLDGALDLLELSGLAHQVAELAVMHDLDLISEGKLTLLEEYSLIDEGLGAALKNLGKSALGGLQRKLAVVAGSDSPWADAVKELGIARFIRGLRSGGRAFLDAVRSGSGGVGYGGRGHGGGGGRGTPMRIEDLFSDLDRSLRAMPKSSRDTRIRELETILARLKALPI